MTAAYLFYSPKFRPLSPSGAILPGAYVQFYESGTTTPADVYADAALTTPLTNPVFADTAGEFPAIYLDPAVTYRAILFDADDVELWDIDPLAPPRDYPAGTIVMFMGDAAARDAAYPPSMWQVCDGTNGTPDLRDRFPIGAGATYAAGDTGGSGGAVTTSTAGAHDHGGVTDETAITIAQMPAHDHAGWYNGGYERDITQAATDRFGPVIPGTTKNDDGVLDSLANSNESTDPITLETGGGDGHDHAISSDGDHSHTVTVTPPFAAVWFLMRRA